MREDFGRIHASGQPAILPDAIPVFADLVFGPASHCQKSWPKMKPMD
jgi:hypothetical protein